MEEALFEKILLNLGEDTPLILIVFMFVRFVWPGLQDLLEQYLKGRTEAAANAAASPIVPGVVKIVLDDSVVRVTDGLVTMVSALSAVGVTGLTADVSPSPKQSSTEERSGSMAARSSEVGTQSPPE